MNDEFDEQKSRLHLLSKTPMALLPCDALRHLIKKPKVYLTNVPSEPLVDVTPENFADLPSTLYEIAENAPIIEFEENKNFSGTVTDGQILEDLPDGSRLLLDFIHEKEATRANNTQMSAPSETKVSLFEGLGGLNSQGSPKSTKSVMIHYGTRKEDLKARRERHKGMYDLKCQEFLANPNPFGLSALLTALQDADSDDINIPQAMLVVQASLKFLHTEPNLTLNCCQLIIQYRIKCPDAPQLNAIDATTEASRAFKQVAFEATDSPVLLANLEKCILLWTTLVRSGSLDDHSAVPLLSAAYRLTTHPVTSSLSRPFNRGKQPNLGDDGFLEKTRRSFGQFIVACYESFISLRAEIVQDYLVYLPSLPTKNNRHYPVSSAPNSGSIQVSVAVLLEMIHVAGQAEMGVWKSATAYRNKATLETELKRATSEALALSNIICRFLITSSENVSKSEPSRVIALNIVEDIGQVLGFVEWPAGELLLKCLVAKLFQLSTVYAEQFTFPGFAFDMLKAIQGSLYQVHISAESPNNDIGAALDYLNSLGRTRTSLYLATRVCLIDSSKYQEHYIRLTSVINVARPKVSSIAANQWLQFLKSLSIGTLYSKIVEVLVAITQQPSAPDRSQVEVLKVLATCVEKDHEFFPKIQDQLLSRLRVAGSTICEWIAQTVIRYVSVTSFDDKEQILEKTVVRMASPGVIAYKKRCIRLLIEVYRETKLQSLRNLAWKHLLRVTVDSDHAVSKLAIDAIESFIFANGSNSEVKSFVALDNLANTILAMQVLSGPYPGLLQRVLRILLLVPHPERHKRATIQALVSHLMSSLDDSSSETLPHVASTSLAAAAAVLEANGLYVPSSKINALFGLATKSKSNPEHRLIALRMLRSAFTARPRPILSPKLTATMFMKLTTMLQVYREAEIEQAAIIIWELASMGGTVDQTARKEALSKLLSKSVLYFEQIKHQYYDNTHENMLKTRQLVFLMAAGVRFWRSKEQIHTNLNQLLHLLIDLANSIEQETTLRLATTRSLTRILTVYPQFFVDPACSDFLDSKILADRSSSEWHQFMTLLLEYLVSQDSEAENEQISSNAKHRPLLKDLKVTANALHGVGMETIAESTSSGLLQKFLPSLLEKALGTDDVLAETTTRLLARAIQSNRVDVHTCVPTIIALSLSTNQEIYKTAESCFASMYQQWGSSVAIRLPEGLKLASSQASIQSGRDCITRLWDVLRSSDTSLKPVMERIANSLSDPDVKYTMLIVEGFGSARLEERDAKILIAGIEKVCYSFNHLDDHHNGGDIARVIALYALRILLIQAHQLFSKNEQHSASCEGFKFTSTSKIFARFSSDVDSARTVFSTMLDLPDDVDSTELSRLIYSRKRPRNGLDL